jgi:plasmid replication initiation protein
LADGVINKKEEGGGLIFASNDLLIEAQWPQLKINEQRLVLYMLSLIQRGDKDFKPYRISIRELCNILGDSRNDLYARFDEATEGLLKKVIRWINPEEKADGRIDKTTWCSSASIIPGKGCVELRFDPTLKPFLLALKGNFTTLGEARAVIRLKNHYSLRIYQFIKYNQGLANIDNRKSVRVEISWFREYLAIPEGTYRLFGHFKAKILLPAQKDIAAKTDVQFDFNQIKKGRKAQEIEFIWSKNKSYQQMELPGISERGGLSSMEDILIMEFGITPDEKAQELVDKYGQNHIKAALQIAREYISKVRKRGQKVESVGGIARKAIEEGWKPQDSIIEIEYETQKKIATQEAVIKKQQEESQEADTRKRRAVAMSRYESMTEGEKGAFLSYFREYLVATDNRIVLKRYDETGVTPGMVEGMLTFFILERLGEVAVVSE